MSTITAISAVSYSEYSELPSEVDVEMYEDLASLMTARSGEFDDCSVYSLPASEVSVEFGGTIKGLTGPLDFDEGTVTLQTAYSDSGLETCIDSESDVSQLATGRDHLDDYLNTATLDVVTGRPEAENLTEFLNTATADVLTGRDHLDDYLNTATADVVTALRGGDEHLDEYLHTAASEVDTGRDNLDSYLHTAHSEVLTGRDHLDDFLNTATADVITARSLYLGCYDTGLQRTDSVETGLNMTSMSIYSEPEAETNVEMDELYPQDEKKKRKMCIIL